MGFLSASVSMTRYRIMDEVPATLWPEALNLLKKYAFKDIDHSAEERSWGWSAADNWLDTAWRDSSPEKGAYLVFNLRLETRRLSPAVFKKHYELEVMDAEREAKTQGQKFLGRERKKELKEQVKLRLLARCLPVPAVFEVAWNTQAGQVWLASTNSKVKELFVNYFADCFELRLEALTPYMLALHQLGDEAGRRLDSLEATTFSI